MRTWQIDRVRPDIDGPWASEPDKAVWVDDKTGLDCLARRNHMGSWCGYVGVPPGHPWYQRERGNPPLSRVHAHGGINFADFGRPAGADFEYGIAAGPGRPDDLWWVGFDCGHADDLSPGLLAALHKVDPIGYPLGGKPSPGLQSIFAHQTYRTFGYVVEQVEHLAAQAYRATGRRIPGAAVTGRRRPHRSANVRRRAIAWDRYQHRARALSADIGSGPGSCRWAQQVFLLRRGASLPPMLTRQLARALRSHRRARLLIRANTGERWEP